MKKHSGGRVAANFRSANIAESLAILMLRPFAAVAPVPREEDYGLDLIGTLLRRNGTVFSAENSFCVQIKTRTSANFPLAGEGIAWLRELDLPYFPAVVDLNNATLALYTLNQHRRAFLPHSLVSVINFTVDGDGLDDFPLGTPLMTWSLEDAAHTDFAQWAYSVLKPAILVEAWNQRFVMAQSIRELTYETQLFKCRRSDGTAAAIPKAGATRHYRPGNSEFIKNTVVDILEPFAGWIANSATNDHRGKELLNIREAMRRLGIEPDPDSTWDKTAEDMDEYARRSS